jgi:hypothetical protein
VTLPAWIAVSTGGVLALVILWDAFETILVPRRIGRRVRLTRYFYLVAWRFWRGLALRVGKASRRESLLGFFGPLSLLVLLCLWACGLILAFALLQWAVLEPARWSLSAVARMIYMSGETFFTLGFGDITPASTTGRALSVVEAGLGFGFLGTVVGYLPTMYSAFSQREIEISLLDARAGSPPTAAEYVTRVFSHGGREWDEEVLRGWERWSAQLLETHISYPQLAYYRSQHSNQSWLGSLTVILDATALLLAGPEGPMTRQAKLTFAMARHAMVDVTQIFVRRPPGEAADRLPAAALLELRRRLADGPMRLPEGEAYEDRLASLRLLYEPYAQALAAFLLFELPPWFHSAPRRDNWRGGPWDRQLASRAEAPAFDEEHF